MDVKAVTKYTRISPSKLMEVTREIQGKSVSNALDTLRFIPRKAARLVEKTLKSAVANATNNANLKAETLRVKLAVADKGPMLKRYKASARGMAAPRLRRTSHVHIVLTDEIPSKGRKAPRRETSAEETPTEA